MSADGGASSARVDLERLAQLAGQAGSAPWRDAGYDDDDGAYLILDRGGLCVALTDLPPDAAFIAAAHPGVVAALVEAVKAAQAVCEYGMHPALLASSLTQAAGKHIVSSIAMDALEAALAPFASAHPADAPLPEGEAT